MKQMEQKAVFMWQLVRGHPKLLTFSPITIEFISFHFDFFLYWMIVGCLMTILNNYAPFVLKML